MIDFSNFEYEKLLKRILEEGVRKEDRTGTGTISLFGPQIEFDLKGSFPLITTKKIWFKGVIGELLWMLKGDTNIKYLNDMDIHIWDQWANKDGDLGKIYGYQWRNFNGQGINQIKNVINEIRINPNSRRLIVSAWNPCQLDEMNLPPCHCFFQFYVIDGKLSCKLLIRSQDQLQGSPWNIAAYSLLTHMAAQVCDLVPDRFIMTIGDAHIYLNHINQVKEQLSREPFSYPQLKINPDVKNIFDFKYEDFELINYKYHPAIKAPIAV